MAGLVGELVRSGTTTFEIKSGYGLTVADEARACRIAAEFTDEVTFLGAHVVPEEFRDDRAGYLDLVTGPMLDACAPPARWIDVFCERGAFDAEEARAVLEAGARAGLGPRVHANQLGPGPGVALAVELGAASADHCTHLSDADVEALAGSGTVATLLPGAEFSTRSPYPDARRLLDAGVSVALATDCNPGTSFTTSMPLCIALAVREMRMTVAEALSGGDPRRRPRPAPRRTRPDRRRWAGGPRRPRCPQLRAPGLPSGRGPDRGGVARRAARARWANGPSARRRVEHPWLTTRAGRAPRRGSRPAPTSTGGRAIAPPGRSRWPCWGCRRTRPRSRRLAPTPRRPPSAPRSRGTPPTYPPRISTLADLMLVDLGDQSDPDTPAGERATIEAVRLFPTAPVLALGGDNSITFAVAHGAWADGLITLDAHHDLRDGRSNGSPVRRLVESGLEGRRIVQIGISDFANSALLRRSRPGARDHRDQPRGARAPADG